MGLDMYAFTAPATAVTQDVDFDLNTIDGITELHYWRKHPNLHGWMRDLYYTKGGTGRDFNCDPLRLTLDDITALEQAIRSGSLPDTSGFFFGETDGSEQNDDLQFIAKARTAIENGFAVCYDSWW